MRTKKNRGFTLIEVLVAVMLLVTIIFWPISIIAELLLFNAVTEQTIKAHFLAQGAIEYVRADRDKAFLTPGSTTWFSDLYESNEYAECVVKAEEWQDFKGGANPDLKYCIPQCANGNCGADIEEIGFVSGMSANNQRSISNDETCDGRDPEENSALTATVNLVVPEQESLTKYANVISCVSWQEEKSGIVRRLEFEEALYEWVQKESI